MAAISPQQWATLRSLHLLASKVLFEEYFKYNVIQIQIFKLLFFHVKDLLSTDVGKKAFLNGYMYIDTWICIKLKDIWKLINHPTPLPSRTGH